MSQSLTKVLKEAAMFANVDVASSSQTFTLLKKPSMGRPSSENTIGCSEESRTYTKMASSAVGVAKDAKSAWMTVLVFTV